MLKQATLDGKRIAYTDDTQFWVQIGKDKSSYKTRYTYYRGINIGNGYKKRLYSPSMNKPTLARALS
jgi:hypothetical protein